MFAKMVLPLLGGAPSVWNTCMVFYQAALLAGYAYAHAAPKVLGVHRQSLAHLGNSYFNLLNPAHRHTPGVDPSYQQQSHLLVITRPSRAQWTSPFYHFHHCPFAPEMVLP